MKIKEKSTMKMEAGRPRRKEDLDIPATARAWARVLLTAGHRPADCTVPRDSGCHQEARGLVFYGIFFLYIPSFLYLLSVT